MNLKVISIKRLEIFTNNYYNYTLNAIIGVITNWLPQENPIKRF